MPLARRHDPSLSKQKTPPSRHDGAQACFHNHGRPRSAPSGGEMFPLLDPPPHTHTGNSFAHRGALLELTYHIPNWIELGIAPIEMTLR